MVEMRVMPRNSLNPIDVEVYGRHGPGENEVQVVFHDLTRTKTLLREMHHRVRRSLNQVNAYLTIQQKFNNDPAIQRVFDALRKRIQATALVHTILKDTAQDENVDMDQYLKVLLTAVFNEHHEHSLSIQYDLFANGIVLDERRATACGLIVTELVTNSLLHAFTARREGRIEVALELHDGRVTLAVTDTGCGYVPGASQKPDSMGLSLVNGLVREELSGRLDLDGQRGGGTRFFIEFSCQKAIRGKHDGSCISSDRGR